MNFNIRKIQAEDKNEVLSMMKEFYSSEAVLTSGSSEIFNSDIENCLNGSPYLEGYVLTVNNDTAGYAMLAKSFSTEFGKPCIWFEDLYLKPEYRGKRIIPDFISYVKNKYKNHIFRLEAETKNAHATHVYQKCGFKIIEYAQFIDS